MSRRFTPAWTEHFRAPIEFCRRRRRHKKKSSGGGAIGAVQT